LKALREREFLAEEEAAERLWRRAEGVCVGCGEPVTLGLGGAGRVCGVAGGGILIAAPGIVRRVERCGRRVPSEAVNAPAAWALPDRPAPLGDGDLHVDWELVVRGGRVPRLPLDPQAAAVRDRRSFRWLTCGWI
jgi:hypothetical protein